MLTLSGSEILGCTDGAGIEGVTAIRRLDNDVD
jgi:hypothetical protein